MTPAPAETLNIISNRLPVTVTRRRGVLNYKSSSGGLATGLMSLSRGGRHCRWIGWPGLPADGLTDAQKADITKTLAEQDSVPIFLTRADVKQYYRSFCNETIWPLFHYFQWIAKYDEANWHAYERVNRAFRDLIVETCSPDEHIWIHDYHLMLLPALLREVWPEARIGFFLHIPFPSFELYRLLPWSHEILQGLLGADLIGFHTFDYVRHFLSSVQRLRGIRHSMDTLQVDGRTVSVAAFPMGIDFAKFAGAASSEAVEKRLARIRSRIDGRKIIVSIDRLDYTKGILQRLEAFDAFLTQHPEHRGKVTLIILAVPSRTAVDDYAQLRETLERMIGRVNGQHGSLGWVPVWYLYRSEPFEQLVALYRLADIALVTPLRDGMNLIAKEYVASRTDGSGVLVLSELAGAASELGEAVTVNPNSRQAMVEAMQRALEMPAAEQRARLDSMQDRLSRHDIRKWAGDFVSALERVPLMHSRHEGLPLSHQVADELVRDHGNGSHNLFIFDYEQRVERALARAGDLRERFKRSLAAIAARPGNEVVIISDFGRKTLADRFDGLDVSLVAEHGAWIREKDGDWEMIEPMRTDWKNTIRPILEMYRERAPGSSIEERDYALVWTCGVCDDAASSRSRKQELRATIADLVEHQDIDVNELEDALEIVNSGIRKSQIARMWIGRRRWDFILGLSGDVAEDEVFHGFPENAHSIHLGPGGSSARYNAGDVSALMSLLEAVAR